MARKTGNYKTTRRFSLWDTVIFDQKLITLALLLLKNEQFNFNLNLASYNDAKARTVEHLNRYLNKNIQIAPGVYIIYNWIMLWPKLTKRIFTK